MGHAGLRLVACPSREQCAGTSRLGALALPLSAALAPRPRQLQGALKGTAGSVDGRGLRPLPSRPPHLAFTLLVKQKPQFRPREASTLEGHPPGPDLSSTCCHGVAPRGGGGGCGSRGLAGARGQVDFLGSMGSGREQAAQLSTEQTLPLGSRHQNPHQGWELQMGISGPRRLWPWRPGGLLTPWESHQDFRSLQAKFQASRTEPTDLPKRLPKPEVNKLQKKFPQAELSRQPQKPPQTEFTDLPQKPSKLELSRKFPQLGTPPKASQPEPSTCAQKPVQADVSDSTLPPSGPKPSAFPKKLRQPESGEALPGSFPKKLPQPEFSAYPRKPLPLQASGLPGKSLPLPEFPEIPPMSPSKAGPTEPQPHVPKPDSSPFPRKPPKPQAGGFPKSLLQPEAREAPHAEAEYELEEPDAPSLKPGFGPFPKTPPKPEFGDLARTSSEPEVSVSPKRPWQPELRPLSKKPPQPPRAGLPRTSSEPEVSALPRKPPEPRPGSAPRKQPPQPGVLRSLPGKAPLPSSVSESSLPAAVAGSGRPALGPGLGRTPRWRSEELRPPPRRPLPPASSLGPPPAKPPLPPGPLNVQSFRRHLAAAAGGAAPTRRRGGGGGGQRHLPLRSPHSRPQNPLLRGDQPPGPEGQGQPTVSWSGGAGAGGLKDPDREHPCRDPDAIYEMYDDVEPTEDRGPAGPRGRDPVLSNQQGTRRLPQDLELSTPILGVRKEKVPQPPQLPTTDPKVLKQMRKAEKAEREFRKKFKFEGEIVVHTRMMIDPNAKTRRGGGKHLGIRRGEILEVIEFTSTDEMLCRDPKGKYGYVPRTALLPLETEVYDDVGFWDPLDNQPFTREP
ncbi:LOW QUALITY PROTEIN: PML-RARA-regulated adapter molecule 1 [Ctenodactylus gundi]